MNEVRVLVVDDEPVTRIITDKVLQAQGFTVRSAESAEAAFALLAEDFRPDLILLDVVMPGLDGYETLAALRREPVTSTIPVIFVTALDAPVDVELGLKLGAADYISKPIHPAVVRARVRTQLENKWARDLLRDQNAWLEAEIGRRMHDNELIQDVSLHTLASLGELRDNETGEHLRRTQAYVALVVGALNRNPAYGPLLEGDKGKAIIRAAPLHDIGKVGIPDHILRKPGRLTAAEFDIIKTHSAIGGEAIELAIDRVISSDQSPLAGDHGALNFLAIAAQIARGHHERWDGRGYPDGLAGDAIPLPARIMALADVYDALISKRVYKEAMPHAEAVALILDGRGEHFDPVIVDVFEELHEQFSDVGQRYRDKTPPTA